QRLWLMFFETHVRGPAGMSVQWLLVLKSPSTDLHLLQVGELGDCYPTFDARFVKTPRYVSDIDATTQIIKNGGKQRVGVCDGGLAGWFLECKLVGAVRSHAPGFLL